MKLLVDPNKIDLLRILNSKGALRFSKLLSIAGFESMKACSELTYLLIKEDLIELNRQQQLYRITNKGLEYLKEIK